MAPLHDGWLNDAEFIRYNPPEKPKPQLLTDRAAATILLLICLPLVLAIVAALIQIGPYLL